MPEQAAARDQRRPVDGAALARIVRRWCAAPGAPWLHGEVARRMAERLALIRAEPRALIDWWGPSGGSRELLRRAYPRARHWDVQAAPAAAASSPRWWSPRRWAGPAVEPVAAESLERSCAELVWANMMLHLVEQPALLMRRWHELLAVDGFLMFSTLGPGSLPQLRRLYADLHWPAPFAPFVDMHDLGDMLIGSGFADPVMDQETITLSWPDAPALLAELRTLGGNADPMRGAGLRTPRWRERLCRELQARAAPDGRLRLDFEIVYGHAFKAAPRAQVAERTTLALEDMRAMVRSGRRGAGGHEGLG